MVAVHGVGRRGGGPGHDLGGRLGFVVDVLVLRDLLALAVQLLEADRVGLSLDVGRVKGEGHVHGAGSGLGSELRPSLHRVAVGVDDLLAVRLPDERPADLVGLAGAQALVGHRVHDGRGGAGRDGLVAVMAVGRGGADLGLDERGGLRLVGGVLVVGHFFAVEGQLLEADRLAASVNQVRSVEGEGHLRLAVGVFRRELARGGHGLVLGVDHGRAVLPYQRAGDGVGLAGAHVLVLHRVGDLGVGHGDHVGPVAVAVGRLGGEAGRGELDGLVLVAGVLVRADGLAREEQLLEADGGPAVLGDAGAVEGERHLGLAGLGLGRELAGAGHFLALRVDDGRAVVPHQARGKLVGLARTHVGVFHGVGDRRAVHGDHVLVAVEAVGRLRGELGRGQAHGLVLVGQVVVARDELAGHVELLGDDACGGIRDAGAVEGEGHLGLAGGQLRRELGGGRHGVALGVFDDLAGILVFESAADLVLHAGGDALVGNLVDDGGAGHGHDVLVAVEAVGGGCGELGHDGGHALAGVVLVLVRREQVVAHVELLEHDQLAGRVEARGVELQRDLGRAARGGRLEGRAPGHEMALGVFDRLAGVCVVQLGRKRVLIAGGQSRIAHRVDDLGAGHGDDHLVAVQPVGRGGADLGRQHGQRLGLVVEVGVRGQKAAARVVERLAGHDGAPAELRGVNGRGCLHRLGGRVGREGRLDRRRAARHLDVGAVGGVLEGGHELVGIALDQAGHVHGVDDVLGGGDAKRLLAGVGGLGRGGHGGRGVVDGAEVDRGGVAPDGEAVVDELLALVGRARQLLDGVLVVGERADRAAVGGRAEPHAARGVELGLVDGEAGLLVALQCRVVGVAGVGRGEGRGVELAVGVGHEHVALAGGLRGHQKRHAGHLLHGLLVALGELQIAALGLLGGDGLGLAGVAVDRELVALGGHVARAVHHDAGDEHLVGDVVSLGCLGLMRHDRAKRHGDLTIGVVEVIARDFIRIRFSVVLECLISK